MLPLVIAGILIGAVGALAASRGLGRAGLVVAGSVLTGLAATAIVQGWLDVVEGDWVANAGVLSLTILAIASILAGLYAVVGRAGLAIGAAPGSRRELAAKHRILRRRRRRRSSVRQAVW